MNKSPISAALHPGGIREPERNSVAVTIEANPAQPGRSLTTAQMIDEAAKCMPPTHDVSVEFELRLLYAVPYDCRGKVLAYEKVCPS